PQRCPAWWTIKGQHAALARVSRRYDWTEMVGIPHRNIPSITWREKMVSTSYLLGGQSFRIRAFPLLPLRRKSEHGRSIRAAPEHVAMDPAGNFAGIVDAMQTEGPAIWAALPFDEQSRVIRHLHVGRPRQLSVMTISRLKPQHAAS